MEGQEITFQFRMQVLLVALFEDIGINRSGAFQGRCKFLSHTCNSSVENINQTVNIFYTRSSNWFRISTENN